MIKPPKRTPSRNINLATRKTGDDSERPKNQIAIAKEKEEAVED